MPLSLLRWLLYYLVGLPRSGTQLGDTQSAAWVTGSMLWHLRPYLPVVSDRASFTRHLHLFTANCIEAYLLPVSTVIALACGT